MATLANIKSQQELKDSTTEIWKAIVSKTKLFYDKIWDSLEVSVILQIKGYLCPQA